MKRYKSHVIWLRGCRFFGAISQTERYQKYQVCLCSRGLFHGIRNRHYLSAAFNMKPERGDLKHVSVNPPSGNAVQQRNATVFKRLSKRYCKVTCFRFSHFTLILPSILTSLCLSVIHAQPHLSLSLSYGPFIPSVTRLSWGVQAGAELTVQEVSARRPLPAVSSPHVFLMTSLSIYKANGFLRVAICLFVDSGLYFLLYFMENIYISKEPEHMRHEGLIGGSLFRKNSMQNWNLHRICRSSVDGKKKKEKKKSPTAAQTPVLGKWLNWAWKKETKQPPGGHHLNSGFLDGLLLILSFLYQLAGV